MTTTPTQPTPAPSTPAPPQPAPQPSPPPTPGPAASTGDDLPDGLGDAGKKAIQAERDARKAAEKATADLQKQLDAINQANESAVEKAQREAKEAQEAAGKAQADALRFRIAAESGITENVDLILTGSDEQTMRAQARLWADKSSPTSPRPDLTQGSKGQPATGDPAQDFANFLGAQMGSRG